MKFSYLFLIILSFLLTACGYSSLSRHENNMLYVSKKYSGRMDKESILYKLLHEEPEKLAQKAIEKKDFRVISLAMGYHASDDDAQILGLKCDSPPATQALVFGCVPPPSIDFKLMLLYNVALVAHPEFPQECAPDKDWQDNLDKWSKKEEESSKKSAIDQIKKWEEKEKRRSTYNR